jgi:peptidoglycan/xylan/chitin deacetylase (PgdA/CDA1 family)
LKRITYVLRNSGLKQTVRKGYRTVVRYGLSRGKMRDNIRSFVDVCSDEGAKGCTLFIPGATVAKEGKLVREIGSRAEFGLHGLRHICYDIVDYPSQLSDLTEGWEIFKSLGLQAKIFRAPYGRTNDHTFRALRDLGCSIDSSRAFCWPIEGKTNQLYDGVLKEYCLLEASVPHEENGVIELPLSLPDDEMLADRLNLPPEKVAEVWSGCVKMASERNQVFVLQLHPHRMKKLGTAMRGAIRTAKDNGMWVGSIGNLVEAWRGAGPEALKGGAVCLSGDIEAMNLLEWMK